MTNQGSAAVREFLRASTREMHARVDRLAGRFQLDNLSDYRRFLSAHAAAVLPLERELREAGITDVVPDWELRTRGKALLADLADLGARSLPLDPPLLGCDASALGAAYVLEGSRLGARYLQQSVPEAFPKRYLDHGRDGSLWPRFVALLEQSHSVRERPHSARAGALAAFSLFDRAFQRENAILELAIAAR